MDSLDELAAADPKVFFYCTLFGPDFKAADRELPGRRDVPRTVDFVGQIPTPGSQNVLFDNRTGADSN